jgi:hypothetical protein
MKIHPMPGEPGELIDFGAEVRRLRHEADSYHPVMSLKVADYRLDALTAGKPKPQKFTLAPLFPLGTVAVLYGPGGVGKSMAALDLCMAVAGRVNQPAGKIDFAVGPLGGNIPPEAGGAVVFVTLEDSTEEVHRRRFALDPDMSCANTPVYVVPGIDIPGFNPALIVPAGTGRRIEPGPFATGLDDLLRNVKASSQRPVRLLVLDPAGDFLDGDENDAQFVKPLMLMLREIAAQHGCTIILLGHTPKGQVDDKVGPTFRGSGAFIANARAAYALWPPNPDDAAKMARKVGCQPNELVYGMLTKANHANAPVMRRRLLRRMSDGRLVDATAMTAAAADEATLLDALVEACRVAAAAGKPFQRTGTGGLYADRADLPPLLSDLSRQRLEDLAQAALDTGRLDKAGITAAGTTKWLDVPDGPIAQGRTVPAMPGSRREAIARHAAGLD